MNETWALVKKKKKFKKTIEYLLGQQEETLNYNSLSSEPMPWQQYRVWQQYIEAHVCFNVPRVRPMNEVGSGSELLTKIILQSMT